jgi:nucleoside 2-deoxyribosyltransferase
MRQCPEAVAQPMKHAFLSHRIDFVGPANARSNHDKYRALLSELGVEIISVADSLDTEVDSTDAEIVEKGLALLAKCDFMIFDCSIEHWNYIGCIFEMAYAHRMNKPIIVYTGATTNNKRPWLRYHATRIVVTEEQLVDAVHDLLWRSE